MKHLSFTQGTRMGQKARARPVGKLCVLTLTKPRCSWCKECSVWAAFIFFKAFVLSARASTVHPLFYLHVLPLKGNDNDEMEDKWVASVNGMTTNLMCHPTLTTTCWLLVHLVRST